MIEKVIIHKLVDDTTSYSAGTAMFDALDRILSSDNTIHLSLYGVSPMSSSFLNSFFGKLIDKYGIEDVKAKVKLVDYRLAEALRIKDYFERYNSITC